METTKDVFERYLGEYLKVNKERKGQILTTVVEVTGLHRKAAIRKFGVLFRAGKSRIKRCGRERYYTHEVVAALRTVWEAGYEVCGELLYPVINEYVDILIRDRMWPHGAEATSRLRLMSEATAKRKVGAFLKARKRKKKGISSTKPSHIKHLVPIFLGPWKDKPPGYGQVDTVRHSDSASGDAVHTLNYTDAATMTVVPRAQWNKGQVATRNAMRAIRERLPFTWLGAHPDTGSEFLNRLVMGWCEEKSIELSRSRPSHKNDNMYVEERNGHVIRKFVGYQTLNCPEAVDALNELYDVLTPFLLHFVAVRRMVEKEKLSSRYRRVYEKKAKTPYQRILEHPAVTEKVKEKLRGEHAALNPLVLKREIDRRRRILYDTQKRYGNRPSSR